MQTIKNELEKKPENLEEAHKIIQEQKQLIQQLQIEVAFQKARESALLEQIRLSKLRQFAPSSEKNIKQLNIFDEVGIHFPEEKEAPIKEIKVNGYTRKEHPVRKPLPKDLPREVIIHDIAENEKVCECGSQLNKIGEEITEQLKYIPAKTVVVQHKRLKYACKPCQENVKIAAMPQLFLPKSIATPELVAHTIVSKYCDHLPLYRQSTIWQRHDIDIPRSSLCTWLMKTAPLCEPLVILLHQAIIHHDYCRADETHIQVLNEPVRPDTSKSFMWVYLGGDLDKPSVVFNYQETRSGYHAQTFLNNFNGFLQTDAYSGYNFTDKMKNITALGCMTHARRPFAELAKTSKKEGLAFEGLRYFEVLYSIETYARENALNYEERFKLRNEKAPPLFEDLKKWLLQNINKVPKQHTLAKAMQYCLNHWNDLTAYLKDGRLEIDNNAVENLIRPLALGRKNFLFMGSPNGARAAAIFYSLIATCKANHIEPYQYFCVMLHKIRSCKTSEDYRKLLPYSIQL